MSEDGGDCAGGDGGGDRDVMITVLGNDGGGDGGGER